MADADERAITHDDGLRQNAEADAASAAMATVRRRDIATDV
jgi:hypothetical protein